MKKHFSIFQFLLMSLFLLCITSCNAQSITQSKVVKHHFIKQYPEEFFMIQCGLQDRMGNMWFGSGADGIYFYDSSASANAGKAAFLNFNRTDGLCHNDMMCCLEDKRGNIWFGTRNGLVVYKPSSAKPTKSDFKSFFISGNVISNVTHTKVPYTYQGADNFVWSIIEDKTGKLWFSTGKGIYIYDPADDPNNDTPVFTAFLDNDKLINKNNLHLKDVTGMVQDKNGTIWFASCFMGGEGICCYDGRSLFNYKPDGLTQFRRVTGSKNGTLYFLNAYKGVYSFAPTATKMLPESETDFTNFSQKIGLKNDTLMAITEDSSGNLWFGTNSDQMMNGGDGGGWRYDPKATGTKVLKLFSTKDGLSHNCIFCIVEDRQKNIWFGTRYTGLCLYNGKTFTDFTER